MNKFYRQKTSNVTMTDAFKQLDGRFFEEDGWPIMNQNHFDETMKSFAAFVTDKNNSKFRNDLRAKLRSYHKNGDIPFGMTSVDIMGSYISGDKPKKAGDLNSRTTRLQGQKYYVNSLAHGFNELLRELNFKFRDDDNYDTPEEALLALEADSMSSKGPYDNGSPDQAVRTVNANLSGVLLHKRWSKEYHTEVNKYFDIRKDQIKGHINPEFQMELFKYVDYMQNRGLKATMRGFPFFAAGNNKIAEHIYKVVLWMFEGVDFNLPTWKESKDLTNDEFIQLTLIRLKETGLKSYEWFNLRHSFIIPISRNQGSGFIFSPEFDKMVDTGERKGLKYRLVTPISAFVQAYSVMGMNDFVTSIVHTRGRIGLQTPSTNVSRMNDFLNLAEAMEQVIISSDYTSYDSTVTSQEMAFSCALGIGLYADEWVQDAFSLAASSLSHKIMVLPTMINDTEGMYSNFIHENMDYIKGDKYHAAKKNLSSMNLSSEELEIDSDYRARGFYIWSGYLPSGHFMTNTSGSEITLLNGKVSVPFWMYQRGYITKVEYETEVLAVASGDDMLQGVPLRLFLAIGYEGVLDLLEKAFAEYGKLIKAAKQIKILLNTFPVVDFLQKVMFQMQGMEYQPEYSKFMRQFPAIPYTERYSKLPFIGQYVIVLGKLESGLCESNVNSAARVMLDTVYNMHSLAQEAGYQVPISQNVKALNDDLKWNSKYSIRESKFGGLEPLLGLVKQYGQGTLSALGKYLASAEATEDLIANFDTELETRAPHRAVLAKAMYRALGKDFTDRAGVAVTGNENSTETYFYSIEMLQKMIEMSEETVKPIILEQQKQVGMPDVVLEEDDGYDNPDDYEF